MNNAQQAASQSMNNSLSGLSKFDLTIKSTMLSTVNTELFNNDMSVTKIYNPANQPGASPQFHPVLGVPGAPLILPVGNQATGLNWVIAYAVGGFDAFTSAVKGVPTIPAGVNTNSYVYIDENGALVYQPGYVNSVLDPGQVTVQSNQTNYRHVFEVSGKAKFTVKFARITVGATYTNQLQQNFSYIQQNIVAAGSQVPFTPSTYVTENQQQNNIITFPVNKQISAKSGLVYPVLPTQAYPAANQISMSLFFTPDTPGMLNLI